MATVPAPTQSQMSDTSLKTHNDTNIPHGTDGSAQCQIDCDIPMQRVPLNDELPYDNDITMMDATNTPIHTMNAKHTQQTQQSNWIDANDVHNKENTKHRTTAATDLDRLIQKSDVQVYDEYEKPSSQKVAANKSSDESNIDVNGIDANILSTDDIDMNGDETDECEQQHNGSEALARRTRARSESPEPCENPRTRNLQMRRQSQPVSEVSQFVSVEKVLRLGRALIIDHTYTLCIIWGNRVYCFGLNMGIAIKSYRFVMMRISVPHTNNNNSSFPPPLPSVASCERDLIQIGKQTHQSHMCASVINR